MNKTQITEFILRLEEEELELLIEEMAFLEKCCCHKGKQHGKAVTIELVPQIPYKRGNA